MSTMIPELIFTIPGLLFLLFIPGYLLTYALFPKKPLETTDRLLLSALTSIALNVIATFALVAVIRMQFGLITLIIQNAAFIILSTALYLARTKRIPHIYLEAYEYSLEKFLKTPTALILVAATMLLAFYIHQEYGYPYLSSEWEHAAGGKQLAETGTLQQGATDVGFHILLAQTYLITGQEAFTYSIFIPALLAGIAALAICSFTGKATGSTHAGILSILFFAGIKSTTGTLGAWFLTPLTLGATYVYGILSLIVSGFEEKDRTKTATGAILIIALALIHGQSAAILASTILAYFILRPSLAKEDKKAAAVLLSISLIALAYSLIGGATYDNETQRAVASPGYILTVYGAIPLLLALAGTLISVKKKGASLAMTSMLLLTSALFIVFQATSLSLLAPYERVAYYVFLALAPLSAYGAYAILDTICKKANKGVIAAAISTMLLAGCAYAIFYNYFDASKSLAKTMDENVYKGLNWFKSTRGKENVILSRNELSPFISTITGNKAVSQIGNATEDNMRFFMSNCTDKKEILKRYDVDYVLVTPEDRMDCEYLPWIYIQKGIYIYEVDKTLL